MVHCGGHYSHVETEYLKRSESQSRCTGSGKYTLESKELEWKERCLSLFSAARTECQRVGKLWIIEFHLADGSGAKKPKSLGLAPGEEFQATPFHHGRQKGQRVLRQRREAQTSPFTNSALQRQPWLPHESRAPMTWSPFRGPNSYYCHKSN